MEIRFMTEEDLEGAYEVEKESFATPWSFDALKRDLANKDLSIYIVAEVDGVIAGYVGSWIVMGEGQITNIAVKKDYRSRGIGAALLYAVIVELERRGSTSIVLEVRVGNENAIKLYEKFGFEVVGKRPKYYTDNKEDALIMCR